MAWTHLDSHTYLFSFEHVDRVMLRFIDMVVTFHLINYHGILWGLALPNLRALTRADYLILVHA